MEKRGLYVALQFSTQQAATLTAGVVGVVLSNLLTPAHLNAWGWRIAMLLGAAVVPFALALRRRLPETLELRGTRQSYRPTRAQLMLGLLTIVMLASATIATYTLNYMNVYATHTLGMSPAVAFGAILAGGGVKRGHVFGASDRIGAYPESDPVRPEDLSATMFHLLGIDPTTEVRDALDRPLPLSAGRPITGILA